MTLSRFTGWLQRLLRWHPASARDRCSSAASQANPIPFPPVAEPISLEASLARVPMICANGVGLQLVLDRTHRQLLVLRDGVIRRRYPAAVGTEGWETPAGVSRAPEGA